MKQTYTRTHMRTEESTQACTHALYWCFFTLSHTHTQYPTPKTVSYVSYLTRMNQFRNKDSSENSVCVRTLAWPILSYRSFNIDLIVRSNDKLLTMNRGTTRSVDISAQIFQTVIWEIAVPRIEIPGTIHKPARTADVVELVCSIYCIKKDRP